MNRTPFYTSFLFLLFTFGFFNPLIAQTAFADYPWLKDIVDTEDCCQNQTVTAYQDGIYTFIYIEKGTTCAADYGELYFEDGTFYCQDFNELDCRKAYGLSAENSTLLWDCEVETNTVFSICLGDSVFLRATQDFPVPLGANGEMSSDDCQPKLMEIGIAPTENSVANDLNGFYVYPTETTFYELVSLGTCSDANGAKADEKIIEYEVIVEKGCATEKEICDNIFEQQWASELKEQACTGNIYTITFDGQPAIYVTTLCACVDAADLIYTCKGAVLCSIGGFSDPTENCEADLIDQLNVENLLWSPECDCPCPVDLTPVCGADGKMYESACEATCAGVAVLDNSTCNPTTCPAMEKLPNSDYCNTCIGEVAIYFYQGADYLVTIEDNPICSDGITTVTNCDSTDAFCFNGGIGGLSQCTDFFKEAVLKEVIWSRKKDCGDKNVTFAAPCTDLKGIDFGLCLAVMGVGIVDGKCQTISGCLDYEFKGVDYSTAFFPTVEICQQTCGLVPENTPEIFDTFEWLSEMIDLEDCKGTTVEIYDLGAYSFLHVQTEESGILYFENGSFYCKDGANYSCRALYGLTEEKMTETWTCGVSDVVSSSPSSSRGGALIRDTPQNILIPSMKAYPNPSGGWVTVDLTNRINDEHTIRVFDLFGRLVEEKVVNTTRTNIDLSGEDAGIYLIETFDGVNRAIQKIIKQ